MDYTIMRAYFNGKLGVVKYKGIIYDLSGPAKWVIVKDLIDGRLIEVLKDKDTTYYCLFKRNDAGNIIYDSRQITQNPNEAIVLCQDILDPLTIEGHPILNNPQVNHLKSKQALGILDYKGKCYDLDLLDDVSALESMMVADGLIELREFGNTPNYGKSPRVQVLDPRFSCLNRLDHLVILTYLVNIKPFYTDKGAK
jgi:hypothetical protein